MKSNLVHKVVGSQYPLWRTVLLIIVLILGLGQTYVSTHFYLLYNKANSQHHDVHHEYYISVTKPINTVASMSNPNANGFTNAEIKNIQNQDFVDRVGAFNPTLFRIVIEPPKGMGHQDFRTLLFLESLPNAFLDVDTTNFKWKEGDKYVPAIIPRSYLDLYNFGFAQSQGMPQVTEGMIKLFVFNLEVKGPKGSHKLQGKVVGFSDRINTLLTPESFVNWGNETLGSVSKSELPEQLLLKLKNPLSSDIGSFFEENQYEISKSDGAKAALTNLINYSSFYVWLNGIIVCALSIIILLLVVYLSIASSKTEIMQLFFLGYGVGKIALPFQKIAAIKLLMAAFISLPIGAVVAGMIVKNSAQLVPFNSAGFQLQLLLVFGALVLLICALVVLLIKVRIKRLSV
ncbi:MAG: hypothetical protein KDC92_00085 [Bacteroidetes bacterium]|nr:hypothetical protein [Bacteroidota bacterium]